MGLGDPLRPFQGTGGLAVADAPAHPMALASAEKAG
jgi:hypothetical protein